MAYAPIIYNFSSSCIHSLDNPPRTWLPYERNRTYIRKDLSMKYRKLIIAAFCALIVGAAIVVWAAESAPSNTVGFFTYELGSGS